MTYTTKTFNLPALQGLSEKQIKVHLALYEGYVKNVNLIMETLTGYAAYGDKATDGDKLAITELRRRFGFEFDGMRMHEYYFEQFEGEKGGSMESALAKATAEKYGSSEKFLAHIREVAGTRGIGWVVVYKDIVADMIHTTFIADHEVPAEKKNYIDAFFANLNWAVIEKRFDEAK